MTGKMFNGLLAVAIALCIAVGADAAPQNSKRAAVTAKKEVSGARAAAVSKPAAHAVSTGRAVKTRTAGIGRAAITRRALSIGRFAFTGNVRQKSEVVNGNLCPIFQAIKKVVDEDGSEVYYKTPTEKCEYPENADEKAWTEASGVPLPSSWIERGEAVIFDCADGYTRRANEQGQTYCLDTVQICPLDIPIGRQVQGKKVVFIDPETEDSCIVPALASANTLTSESAILNCVRNTYSAPIEGAGEDHLECRQCPIGFITINNGSRDPETCVRRCPDGKGPSPDQSVCLPCSPNAAYDDSTFSCKCELGYFGPGAGEDGCQLCPIGSYCEDGHDTIEAVVANNEYAPIRGLSEPLVCPEGSTSTGASCDSGDEHKIFDLTSGACVTSWCPDGKTLEGTACVTCPAGYSCVAGTIDVAPVVCPKGSYCPAGAVAPTNCGNKYCPNTGMSAPLDCPVGATCVNGDIGGCTAGYNYNLEAKTCQQCRAGYRCPNGVEQMCPVMTYSAAGATVCTDCPSGQVSGSASDKCIPGRLTHYGTYYGSFFLPPGMYKFEIAGGGGGAGASTCDNCGGRGWSQAGGNGEMIDTGIIIIGAWPYNVWDTSTYVKVILGQGGQGGYGNDPNDAIFSGNGNKCHFTCKYRAKCHSGNSGGNTAVSVNGRTWVASGGPGGEGKEWLTKIGNNGELWYTQYTPRHAGNGLGGQGGAKTGGESWSTSRAQGYNGSSGWVKVYRISY